VPHPGCHKGRLALDPHLLIHTPGSPRTMAAEVFTKNGVEVSWPLCSRGRVDTVYVNKVRSPYVSQAWWTSDVG